MNATSTHLLLGAKLALAVPELLHIVLGYGVLPGALGRCEEHGHDTSGRVDIDQHHHGEGVILPGPGADIHRHLVKSILRKVQIKYPVNTSLMSSILMACSMALSLAPALLMAHPMLKKMF